MISAKILGSFVNFVPHKLLLHGVCMTCYCRALFDGERKKLDPSCKPHKQAFLMCSYCSKSIATDTPRNGKSAKVT